LDYGEFYSNLFVPIEEAFVGSIDRDTLMAIVGFDAGGPLNFCTIGHERGDKFVTYVSCELAVRRQQKPSEFGRYELLMTCDDEEWARSLLSDIGRMSLDVAFGDAHTLDIGRWVKPRGPIQGVAFEKFACVEIGGEKFGILRCIGITRPELKYAQKHGVPALVTRLKEAGAYPNSSVRRHSVI